jgi:glycine cleavage system regulatory protein
MAKLVLTAIGEDREGLVTSLAREVRSYGGNWLDSQFSHLAGMFAGLVLVEIPDDQVGALESAVTALREEIGWKVEVTRAGGSSADGTPLSVHLLGQDRPGMVHQISEALTSVHVSIDGFRSWTAPAPEGGGVLFEAEAELQLPEGADVDTVGDALEPIAAELMVDLELEGPDA